MVLDHSEQCRRVGESGSSRMTGQGDDTARQLVLAQLGWGRDNALPLSAIAERLGWSRRAVEQAVQALRIDGKAVASGSEGVWLGDAADMAATYAYLRGRIVSQSVTAWAVRSTLRRMRAAEVQQLPMFDAA